MVNRLYYGDNLDVLREHVKDESIDLIYLDPPFNSNRSYSLLFKEKSGEKSQAQLEAFDDTWTWSQETEATYAALLNDHVTTNRVRDALEAMRRLLGDNDVLAYLVMMTARLIELRRVLKPTGSLYLHCDPTASHYLKIILDAIFGPESFRNEIIWRRTPFKGSSKARAQQLPKSHDVILFYTKGDTWTWTPPVTDYSPEYLARFKWDDGDGRGSYRKTSLKTYSQATLERLRESGELIEPVRAGAGYSYKQYLSRSSGKSQFDDVWTDINMLNPAAKERLGYPTQKPLSLLERIIAASSNEGDTILDPFCGCGTSVDASQRLNRRWIGIDITTLAVDLIDARLRHTYGESVRSSYEVLGIPRDMSGARALFKRNPFEFERWCVMLLDGQPNEKQVGDRGIDGVIRFPIDAKGGSDRILFSVKGGATNPGHVRDLVGTVDSQRAATGLFICMIEPTRGMIDAANHSGTYVHPATAQHYPKVQIITVRELLDGKRPKMPATLSPYFQAKRRYGDDEGQLALDIR